MADTLLIHFHPDRPETSWVLVNDAGEMTCKLATGELAQAAELARQRRVVVLLDATLAHIDQVHLPTRNQQKLMRAIPFALEEQLADDIEDMHFVAGRGGNESATPVVAIHRHVMDRMLAIFEQAGIQPHSIVPDALCLAANEQQWCALFDKDQVILQTAELHGSKFDADLFDTLLAAELKRASTPPQKLLLFTADTATPPAVAIDSETEIIAVQYNAHPLVVFAGHYRQALSLNLLQHDYKLKKQGGLAWKRWRLAASLAAVWLLLSMAITAFELDRIKQQNRQLEAEIINLYKKAFPESKRIVNARVQMEQKLKALKSGNGSADSLIALLASSSSALADSKGVTLKSINFRNNRLDISVNSKDLAALQQLNNQLNQANGIQSEIISSSSEQNRVKANLRIRKTAS